MNDEPRNPDTANSGDSAQEFRAPQDAAGWHRARHFRHARIGSCRPTGPGATDVGAERRRWQAQYPGHLRRRHRRSNISAYLTASWATRRPTSTASAKEGIRFLHYYGEQSCTAGRAAFLTGQHGIRTGLTKVGFPGAPMGMSQLDPSDRRPAQEPGLRHGPVRQEPRRRPQRVAADGEWLRRVLRQPLPPQRRGGARAARLSEGSRPIAPSLGRAACSSARPPTRTIPPSTRASARSASRPSRTPAPLTKKRMETIDDETSAAAIDLHETAARGGQAVLRLVQLDAHAPAHARARRTSRPLQAWRQRIHRRHARARRYHRHAAEGPGRNGHCQRHRSSSTRATTART